MQQSFLHLLIPEAAKEQNEEPLEGIEESKYDVEHSIASLDHCGKTETPSEPQEWCEDPDTLADLE